MWTTRCGTQSTVQSMSIILEHWFSLLHMQAFLHKETEVNRKFINYTRDLSVPEYVIKKGRFHGHRYGKKPGDKEYFTANQLKKRCKKKYFQGIHDRFIRDPQFRSRMIENYRDEEPLSTIGCFADEDHTHHVTTQEYSFYKGKWWLHPNKQGSDTVPLRQRLHFKQALSTLHQLQREAEGDAQVLTYSIITNNGVDTEIIFYMVELARSLVVFLQFRKSRRMWAKSWEWRVRPVIHSTLAKTSEDGFHEFNSFCHRWIVYSWRQSTVPDGRCKDDTSIDPFLRCKSVQ